MLEGTGRVPDAQLQVGRSAAGQVLAAGRRGSHGSPGKEPLLWAALKHVVPPGLQGKACVGLSLELSWPPRGEASRTASALAQSTRGTERGSTSPGEGRPLDTACFLSKPSRIRSVSSKRIGVSIELNEGLEWYQVGSRRQEESSAPLSPGPRRAGP